MFVKKPLLKIEDNVRYNGFLEVINFASAGDIRLRKTRASEAERKVFRRTYQKLRGLYDSGLPASGIVQKLDMAAKEKRPFLALKMYKKLGKDNFKRLDFSDRLHLIAAMQSMSSKKAKFSWFIHLTSAISSLKLDDDFILREKSFADEFIKDLNSSKDFEEQGRGWAFKSNRKRNVILQNIAKKQAEHFGFDVPKIEVVNKVDITGFRRFEGMYEPKNDRVSVNTALCFSGVSGFYGSVSTLVHEVTHARQYRLAERFGAGEIKPDNDDYETAAMFWLAYQDWGYVPSFPGFIMKYYNQPLEQHANIVGKYVVRKVTGFGRALDRLFGQDKGLVLDSGADSKSNPPPSSKL